MRLRRSRHSVEVGYGNAAIELVGSVEHGRRAAVTHIDSIGVIERLRIFDVAREAAQWAALIRRHGVRPAENVVVLADRDRHWRSALVGVLETGAVAVPCPAAAPPATIRAIAFDAGAPTILSARPRPDLEESNAPHVLCADDFEHSNAARAAERVPYPSSPDDLAVVLYAHDEAGLHAAEHTHSSLLVQAAAAERWLGVREGQCVWCTAAEGSHESIWLLLAAWRLGAEILTVEESPAIGEALELLDQFAPAAVWFSDDEYAALAGAEVPAWIDLGRVQRALTSGEPGVGAAAFAERFATTVTPVFASAEPGVVVDAATDDVSASLLPQFQQRDAESGLWRQRDEERLDESTKGEALAPEIISGISRHGMTGRPGPRGPDKRRLAD